MDVQANATPRLILPREQKQHELYLDFVNLCAKQRANTEMAAGAAMHLLITLVHRLNEDRHWAEVQWDDLWGQGKEILKERFHKRFDAAGHEFEIPL